MKVKAENLQIKYGNQLALKDVSFELNGEKIYGLLGRNGAGKTTLLSILASFREPTSGSLTINGEIPFENAKVMQQVAFLYNKDYKDESDNVIAMLEDVQRYRPHFDRDYADFLIDRFMLDKKKPIKQFSKGMQSSLNVIIGLASRSPITIFDEVYLGMDAPSREIFYKELIQDQEKHPRIIILSTHLVSEMEYLFDEVLLLDRGSILLQDDYDSLISKGASITGNVELVDEFVKGMRQINIQQLGNTKSVTVYGELTDHEKEAAFKSGLDIAPVSLHDLFVHLTQGGN